MRKLVLLGILFLLSGIARSQSPFNSPDILIYPFWDFYAENKLSATNAGKGNTGVAAENDLSGITLNPASFEPVTKFQVIASYEMKSSVPWFSSDMYLKTIHPTVLAGVGYKINNYFSAGLIYSNQNSFKIDLGKILQTNEFGQIIGTYEGYQRYTTNNFTVPLVYKSKYFKAGVNLNAIWYKGFSGYGESDSNQFSTSFWKFIPKVGIITSPTETFSFGFTYSPSYKQTIEWTSANSANTYKYNTPNYYPATFSAGTELKLLDKRLIFDLDYRFANTSINPAMKDRHDINFGAQYSVMPDLILRTGFFTSLDYREGSNYMEEVGTYNTYYLTFGGTYKYKGYSLSMSLINGDLIRKTSVSHTRLGATLSYDFDLK
jgi:hypothetical protein